MVVRTMEDLNDYMLLHGHKGLGDFELTDELIEAIKEINTFEVPFKNGTQFKYIHKITMKKHARKFMEQYYNLHKVGYLSDVKLISLLHNKKIGTIGDLIDSYNDGAIYLDPFRLPVDFNIKSVNGGTLLTQALVTEDHEYFKELLPELNLYFSRIYLPKSTTDISTASYVHEITHSQLESNKGIIEEFHNAEVISIFNELLYAYNHSEKLFNYLLMNRLNSLFMSFNSMYEYKTNNSGKNILEDRVYTEFDYHTDIKYLSSTLKAFKLLALFIGDDKLNSKYIIHQINRVFDGQRTLEECLSDFNVTLDNSIDPKYTRSLIRS